MLLVFLEIKDRECVEVVCACLPSDLVPGVASLLSVGCISSLRLLSPFPFKQLLSVVCSILFRPWFSGAGLDNYPASALNSVDPWTHHPDSVAFLLCPAVTVHGKWALPLKGVPPSSSSGYSKIPSKGNKDGHRLPTSERFSFLRPFQGIRMPSEHDLC